MLPITPLPNRLAPAAGFKPASFRLKGEDPGSPDDDGMKRVDHYAPAPLPDLILDGLTEDQVRSLLAKLDKYHPDLATAGPQWRLHRMRALAHGSVEPAEKTKPRPKPTKGKKT
jgi:hypothetical protein